MGTQSITPDVLLIKVTFQSCWIFNLSILENRCIKTVILCIYITEDGALDCSCEAGRETSADCNNILLAALAS